MGKPIILDCDPGHDDAVAILLAHADPAVDLLAITTVAGNQVLAKTTLNARRVCTVARITDVPIAAGADRPLRRPLGVAEDIHGGSGLDGFEFGPPTVDAVDEPATDLIRRLLREAGEPVTVVATGPLTNVATLLRDHPEVREHIAEIVFMGGSTDRGNTTPYAEFNIHTDPEAADMVLSSGLPVTMVGLNVTHQALVTPGIVATLHEIGTPVALMCAGLMTFFGDAYRTVFGFPSPPLHDPLAVARVIRPDVVGVVPAPVVVETAGEHTSGATVVDLHHVTGRPDNALVAVEFHGDRFWPMVLDAVRWYGTR